MGERLLVGTRKGLFTVVKKKARWEVDRVDFFGDTVGIVLPDPRDGSIYVALEHGHFGPKLHRSTDGGATWAETGLPKYPEPGPGDLTVNPVSGKEVPWKLEKVWSLEPGHASEPGVLWCGTLPGGLFRSDDSGATWSLVEPLWNDPSRPRWFGGGADLPGIHSICVHPENPADLLVGVSCAGVWRTADGGASWACKATGMRAAYMPPELAYEPVAQDPHRVVRCPARPEVLWAQHHNGIFRTVDGAESWQEITDVVPSTFGFAVAVHPEDPDVAWFVPAQSDERRVPSEGRVVVTRTRDGGRSFDVLREGLPQRHAYDIVYRHALDVDRQGESLAFGSTTGSLWVSDDQGDTWQCVSQHLPPVYSVRFAG